MVFPLLLVSSCLFVLGFRALGSNVLTLSSTAENIQVSFDKVVIDKYFVNKGA